MENETVGYFVIEERTYADNPFSKEVKSIYIQQLNVNSNVRGQGVGKLMMQHIREFALQKGVSRIELDVKHKNDAAKRFFKKMDYVLFNAMMEYLF